MTARLAALAGAAPAAPPWLTLTAAEQDAARRWLEERGIHGRFVVLAPGARWGTKRWPWYPALAAALDVPLVVVGDARDVPLAEAVLAAAPGRAVSGAGHLDLRIAAAVLARSALVVSNDSLALHLAGGMGRPVLALFGPTVPAFGFGPLGLEDTVLEHPDLRCRPCSPHGPARCPLGHHRCLRELAVPEVAAAVARALARTAGREGQ
jgi:heptosyltransferase-2